MGAQCRGRRRRWRQRRLGLRRRCGHARNRLHLDWHVGRDFRDRRQLSAQHRRRRAYLLPRGAGNLAPDGGGAFCRRIAGLAGPHCRPFGRRSHRAVWEPIRYGPSSLRFLPYLSGERTPVNDAFHPRRLCRDRPGVTASPTSLRPYWKAWPSRSAIAWMC